MKRLYLLSVFIFASLFLKAQTPEKIYIHFDKDIYLPGETVWFKAYVFNNNQLSSLSTVFYTAIYDASGKLIKQKKYPIFNGETNGDFELADTLKTSSLQFVAFTRLMWQIDSSKLYEKAIPVYQDKNIAYDKQKPQKSEISLQFFTEGGTAVEAVPNYFAFKANYSNGRPAQIEGSIVDETNNTVSSFFTNALGLGKVQIQPDKNKVYTAVWKKENGESGHTLLPVIDKIGASFHTEQSGGWLYYSINKSENNDKLNLLSLKAKMNGAEVYNASLNLGKLLKYVDKIPLDSFANGIMEMELLDTKNNVLQKRKVFINHEYKTAQIINLQKSSLPKGQNIIEIDLIDTFKYNLSVSIADISFYENLGSNGIQGEIWFNGNKNLYKLSKENADLLMLTQERSNSKVNLQTNISTDNYLNIIADYKNKNFGLPKTEELSLIINDSITGKQFFTSAPATPTSFNQSGLIFYDSARIYYRFKDDKEMEKYLTLQLVENIKMQRFVKSIENISGKDSSLNRNGQVPMVNNDLQIFIKPKQIAFNEIQTIEGVSVKTRYISPETKRMLELDNKYASGMFSGLARGIQVNVADDPKADRAIDIYSYLVKNLPGLQYTGRLGERIITHPRGTPILFIDETEREMNELESVSPAQIAYIKYVQGIVIGSSFTSSSGALYIYYKKGNDVKISSIPNMRFVKLKGFDWPQQFNNPDYTKAEERKKSDLRSTLYWEPNLIGDNPKIKIEYFNNDISKKLLLIIEGINENGELIHIEKVIEN